MPFFFARNRFFGRWTRLSFRSIRSARSNNASENGIQAKEATEDIFEGIKTHIERKAGFKQWLAEIKRKLTEQPTGPFLLGASRPFAHNPEFAPRPPITEALRDRLYQLYTTEPSNWTPRKLSAAFKVSIPRIKAIIKIKEREIKTIAEGKLKPDQEYVQKMEEILGAQAPVQVEPELTRDNSISAHVRPTFVAIPENSDISPEEASKILGIKLKTLQPRQELESICNLDDVDAKKGQLIRFDPYEKGRIPFVFVDTSSGVSPKTRQVWVRDPNGDLRMAGRKERLKAARKVYGRSANKCLD